MIKDNPLLKRLLTKYDMMSLPVKAALWFTACQFIQKGVGMITTPVFTRLLSTEEYGRASAFLSWADIFIPLIALSTWRGMMNLYAKDRDKDSVLSAIIGLSIFIAALWMLPMVILSEKAIALIGFTFPLIMCLFLFSLSQNIFLTWMVRMQYDYCYKPLTITTVMYTIVTAFGGALLILMYSRTAEAKLYPQIVMLAVISLVIIIVSLKKRPIFYDKETWRFCLTFAVPLIPHYLSEVILQSSDRIMINNMCTSAEVAIYSIAYAVGSLINLVSNAINSSFVPYQYQKIKSRDYITLAENTNIIIGFVAVCLCLFMLFGREIVLIFGGDKYIDSVNIIIPICLGVFFNYVFQLFARVQEYFEQKFTIVIASVSCALLNIVLNYIFIDIYGYKAAAYTTFACYFVFCFLHYWFYRMACDRNIGQEIYDIKSLVIISTSIIVLSPIIAFLSDLYLLKYTILIIALVFVSVKRRTIIGFVNAIKK